MTTGRGWESVIGRQGLSLGFLLSQEPAPTIVRRWCHQMVQKSKTFLNADGTMVGTNLEAFYKELREETEEGQLIVSKIDNILKGSFKHGPCLRADF